MEQEHERPIIFTVSDSVGETAEFVVSAAASQFNSGHVEVRRHSYVTTEEHLMAVIEEASFYPHSIIAYTLVSSTLSEILEKEASLRGIPTVDIIGPMMRVLEQVMNLAPKMEPGLIRRLNEEYFRRVAAIEFAVKYDDGKDPRGLELADIVLVGVSRTSKTPLSMYLANKRFKVANVPVVPEVGPPEELFKVSTRKIIGLTISPQQLNEIRQERLRTLGLKGKADYASLERILEELEYAEALMRKLRCPVINVTNKAVEETANKIMEIIGKGESSVE